MVCYKLLEDLFVCITARISRKLNSTLLKSNNSALNTIGSSSSLPKRHFNMPINVKCSQTGVDKCGTLWSRLTSLRSSNHDGSARSWPKLLRVPSYVRRRGACNLQSMMMMMMMVMRNESQRSNDHVSVGAGSGR